MSSYAGKIVLSTKIDTSGIEKGTHSIKKAASGTGTAMKGLARTIATTFSISMLLKFSKQSADVATQTESNIMRLVDVYGRASQEVSKFIDENARALGMSRSAASNFSAVYGNLFSVWADQQENAMITTDYLNMTAVVASKTGRTMEDTQERIRSGLLGNTEAIEDLGIFVNVKTVEMTAAFQKMANGRSWDQLSAHEQQQVRALAILEQATKKYGTEVANTSTLTKAKYQAAYEDFQATWGQVVNVVLLPVLEVLTEIFNVAIKGIQTIFGLSSSTSATAEEYSQNIGVATDNQEDLNKEVQDTSKSLKKATAGFDELQVLSSNTSDSSSGINLEEFGIGKIGSVGDASEVVEGCRSNLEEIMIAVGAALAAVGVLLLFSGQIAWGIGFIIAGAAIFSVSAASLSEDTASQNVINTLNIIMGAVAGALVAIGIILITVGSTALGIGFIVAGAALLGVTVFSITEFSTDPIETTLLTIEAIAGGAMLALGIMLLYFGVNKPLAIGLIVAGAALLVTAVAQLAAGAVSEEVAAWIYGITAIVSTALLVIGIIMLCAGHISPLSIGLVVAGAVGLATTVAINWNAIVDAIRGPIGKIVAIVSAALLVLGVILLLTGVGIPLGIGLIVAGAAGLVAVVALNWNAIVTTIKDTFNSINEWIQSHGFIMLILGIILLFTGVAIPVGLALIGLGVKGMVSGKDPLWNVIVDKIKEVWQKIKAFWNQHIAPIFTGEFWKSLAKKCGNGLIAGFEGAINGIISMFESMINWVVNGLNKISFDVPDWVPGIGGSTFGFSIPEVKFNRVSIPRLAQGAVIPPNREFMAVLGDQRHGTNIEAPLETIKQALAEVLALQENSFESATNINFTGDLAQLARVLKPAIETETRRRGGSLAKGATF